MKILQIYFCLLLLFLWAPLVAVLFKGSAPEAFVLLWKNSELLLAFRNSLVLGAITAFLSTILGLATAFALPSFSPKVRAWVTGSLLLPLLLPEIAFGIAYLVWFRDLGLSLGWETLLLAHFAFTFCFVVLVLKTSVARLDSSLADAARDLGANGLQVFRHALLPQLLPGILAGAAMAFSLSLDDFLISFFVKGIDQITLPIKIYSMMRLRIGPEIYALSVVLFAISLFGVLFTQLWHAKNSRT
ncbi:MAG TPA: ABC transporter permease [Bdellovibrionota bacterium]|jgi:spermidine/putrescine transport system permease protein